MQRLLFHCCSVPIRGCTNATAHRCCHSLLAPSSHLSPTQVLRHKKFGFRCVVFGWEKRPHLDVSHWDGVIGLPSGAEQPFYRMIPDHDDCVSLIGGPRGVRYVAQENLETLPSASDADISHELLPHLFHAFDRKRGTFLPVQQLEYWYPSDRPPSMDAEAAAAAAASGEATAADADALPTLSVTAQATRASVDSVVRAVESARDLLRAHALDASQGAVLEPLLQLLSSARDGEEASAAERAAGVLLASHSSNELASLMGQADAHLDSDDVADALVALDLAVQVDDTHAETYARRAAVHMRSGRARRALADASRALELEPRHLSALRLKGAALRGARRYEEAIAAYEAALHVHPWAPGVVNGVYRSSKSLKVRGGSAGARGGDRRRPQKT